MIKLFIDFNHLSIRNLFHNYTFDWRKESFDFHKHLLCTSLFKAIKKFNPNEVILAIDDKQNWRKIVYPDYKANRKLLRDASNFPWKEYFEYIEKFIEELKIFPFKILRIKYTEADDIIAVLSKHFFETENIIVTSDSDYIQLLQYNQNRLYDPIKQKFIEEENPIKALKIKIIKGDSLDNIPAIKPKVGKKTAIKLIETGELEKLLEDENIKKNYLRNEVLISFDRIPHTIQKTILTEYSKIKLLTTHNNYFEWCVTHKLSEWADKVNQIVNLMDKLIRKEEFYDKKAE